MYSDQQEHNHKINLQFIKLTFAVALAGTLIRPLFISLSLLFTLLGLLNLLIIGFIYLAVKRRWCPRWEALSVFIIGIATITPLLLVSGGVNSQFAPLLPMIPLATALIGGERLSVLVSGLLVGLVIVLVLFHPLISDLTNEVTSQEKILSKAVWYFLTICSACYFGIFFYRRNRYLQEQLQKLASIDFLTDVYNRRGFLMIAEQQIEVSKRATQPFSLALIDIDHFKRINDVFGHDIGDRCLKSVASALSGALRGQDILGRYGGEEFILLLPNTPLDEAKVVAEKLRHKVENLSITGTDIRLTITIGISGSDNVPSEGRIERYISQADIALYQGKDDGRNRSVVFVH